VIFSKSGFLEGGLTFMRVYVSQRSKHPHYPPKDCLTFCGTNKS